MKLLLVISFIVHAMANKTLITKTPLQFTPQSQVPKVVGGMPANDEPFPPKLPAPHVMVVGGDSAFDEQFPFTAELSINTKNGGFLCSGSLIASDWVVTARHCIAG